MRPALLVHELGFFVAISVLMMVVDHQMQVMEPVRSGFAWVSDWIHNGVSSPARGVDFADSTCVLSLPLSHKTKS